MKLIFAIISSEDAPKVNKALIQNNFFVTKLSSSGGFLSSRNITLMLGVEDTRLDEAIKIFTEYSHTRNEVIPSSIAREFGIASSIPTKVTVGGATLFIINVEQYLKI